MRFRLTLMFLFFVSMNLVGCNSSLSTTTPSPSAIPLPSSTPTSTRTATPTTSPTPTETATLTVTPTPVGGNPMVFVEHEYKHPAKLSIFDGQQIRTLVERELSPHFPQWSPDKAWIAFMGVSDYYYANVPSSTPVENKIVQARLYVVRPDGSDLKELAAFTYPALTEEDSDPLGNFYFWSPDGSRIVYLNQISYEVSREKENPVVFEIMVVPVDGGEPLKVGETTMAWDNAEFWVRPFDWSPDSKKIVFTNYHPVDYGVYTVNADGSELTRLTQIRYAKLPIWMDNGETIVFQLTRFISSNSRPLDDSPHNAFDPGEVFMIGVDGKNLHSLNIDAHESMLSPDGSKIAYFDYNKSFRDLKIFDFNSAEETVLATKICKPSDKIFVLTWSPDSTLIAFKSAEAVGEGTCFYSQTTFVHIYDLEGNQRYLFPVRSGSEWFDFSPDSRYFAVNLIVDPSATWFTADFTIVDLKDGSERSLELNNVSHPAWQ